MDSFFSAFGQALADQLKIGHRDISQGIREAIDLRPRWTVSIGSFQLPVTDAMISIAVTIVLLTLLAALFVGRRPAERPGRRQALAEKLIETVLNMCRSTGLNESQAERILPWTLSLGLYIMVSNVISVIHIKPASQNPAFPISLALFSLVFVIVNGIRFVGFKGFLYSMIDPMPAILPFNILDYIIKPISLAFRLFGNIFGAFILIEFLSLVVPIIIPTLFGLWFDVGDGIVQGVIFMFLTTNYVGEICEKSAASQERMAEKRRLKAERTAARPSP